MTRILVLWCPEWSVSSAGHRADEKVAVVEGNRIRVVSKGGRAAGVRVGLGPREAESRCPGIVLLERDPAREARVFEPVVAAVETITPRVEIIRPGVLALETRGPARYLGGEKALCMQVGEVAGVAMPQVGVPIPQVGVADGRFAAVLAARGRLVVPEGGNTSFLAPFPLSVLELPELADLLGRLGVRTLGDFAGLPEATVLARFGPRAARAHRQARGLGEEGISAECSPERPVASRGFDPPVERAETAAFLARRLVGELIAQLDVRGFGCLRVRIEAETEHGEKLSRLWRAEGLLGAEEILERLRWQLEGWLSGTTREPAPSAGITRLTLAADEVIPAGSLQLGLWGGTSDTERRAIRGLDRLRGMLGPEALVTAVLQGGRGPSDRVTFLPWGEPRSAGNPIVPPWPGHHPLPAPALVYRVPIPADLRDAEGSPVTVSARGQISGVPAQLSCTGSPSRRVLNWAGPWTADERWWDLRTRRRRARCQILTEGQEAYLCVVEEGRWWIEGTYD
jgi:protein ImuB